MLSSGPQSLEGRVHDFVDALRSAGLTVPVSERIDAMRAVEITSVVPTSGLYTALCATLVKDARHLGLFDELFDLFFRSPERRTDPRGEDPLDADDGRPGRREHAPNDAPPRELDTAVRHVLASGSPELARVVAEQAVDAFVDVVPGRAMAGVLYNRMALDGLRLDRIPAEGPGPSAGLALIRREVAAVIRELLVADRGARAVAEVMRGRVVDEVDISTSSADDLAEIQRALRPLQRTLATTLIRKRRRSSGRIDAGAMMRASMGTGGVPIRILFRDQVATKPDLYVLADMSRSVAQFGAFTTSLLSGLAHLFSRFRSFAFVENTVEVTAIFRDDDDPERALDSIRAIDVLDVARARTDYGRALTQFWDSVNGELSHRSTVLVFGDGRGNFRPPRVDVLERIAARAGKIYWLSPEPRDRWNTGDSAMEIYEPRCTEALPCRTLADLRRFVAALE